VVVFSVEIQKDCLPREYQAHLRKAVYRFSVKVYSKAISETRTLIKVYSNANAVVSLYATGTRASGHWVVTLTGQSEISEN